MTNLQDLFSDTLEIPPHCSHLFQRLDIVTNPSFKAHLTKYKSTPSHLTDRSKRIYNIVDSMNKNINSLQNMQAFDETKPLHF